MDQLRWRAAAGFVALVVVLGLLLFMPAGTWRYWQAWLYLGTFFVETGAITLYLAKHDPGLLSRRVRAGPAAESDPRQRLIQSIAQLAFVAMFLVPAFDRRLGWSQVPLAAVFLGDVLVVGGLFVVLLVFRENSYTSAVIEVAEEQPLVTSGPYALVRHPMYAGALIFLIGTPLALGSWWGLAAFLPIAAVIGWRMVEEERVLTSELRGYSEYRARIRSRLIPGVL